MSVRKLQKSRTNKMLGGVAAGIAEYLNLDPTLIRLLFVFLFCCGGSGLLLYIILLIIMPTNYSNTFDTPPNQKKRSEPFIVDESGNTIYEEVKEETQQEEFSEKAKRVAEDFSQMAKESDGSKLAGAIIGTILIFFGLYILLSKFFHFNWFSFVVPIFLVCIGVVVIAVSIKSKNS